MISIARVKQATSEFVKILRMGKNDVQTAQQASPYGFDSKPPKNAIVVHAKTAQKSEPVILGTIAPPSEETSEGESRMYVTDSSGEVVFYIKLNNTGQAVFNGTGDFLARFNELQTGFDQLKSDFNDLVNAFNSHTHTYAPGPGAPVATGPVSSSGSTSSASIDNAKIDNMEVEAYTAPPE